MPEAARGLSVALHRRGNTVDVATTDVLAPGVRLTRPIADLEGPKILRSRVLSLQLAESFELYVCPRQALVSSNFLDSYDAVHFHGARGFQNAVWAPRLRRDGVPCVMQPHGSLPYVGANQGAKRLYDALIGRQLVKTYDKVAALSVNEASCFPSFGIKSEKTALLPNGIDRADFRDLPTRGALRDELAISDDELVFTFLGRINKIKGLDILAPAFDLAARRLSGQKLRLIIAGPPSDFASQLSELVIRSQTPEKIVVLGVVSGKRKLQLLIDTDWLVVPSHYEVFSLAVLEAAMVGVPAILSRASSFTEFADQDAALVSDPNPISYSKAIEFAVRNPELRNDFGRKARSLTLESFTWDLIAPRAENIYREIATSQSRIPNCILG